MLFISCCLYPFLIGSRLSFRQFACCDLSIRNHNISTVNSKRSQCQTEVQAMWDPREIEATPEWNRSDTKPEPEEAQTNSRSGTDLRWKCNRCDLEYNIDLSEAEVKPKRHEWDRRKAKQCELDVKPTWNPNEIKEEPKWDALCLPKSSYLTLFGFIGYISYILIFPQTYLSTGVLADLVREPVVQSLARGLLKNDKPRWFLAPGSVEPPKNVENALFFNVFG